MTAVADGILFVFRGGRGRAQNSAKFQARMKRFKRSFFQTQLKNFSLQTQNVSHIGESSLLEYIQYRPEFQALDHLATPEYPQSFLFSHL